MTVSKIVAAAASSAGSDPLDVDDVFSTFLYDGNGSARSINNGVDLGGKGGLVWFKQTNTSRDHGLFDTERGTGKYLITNDTNVEAATSTMLSAFNSDGFSLAGGGGIVNNSAGSYVSYSFRKAEKFFDVVTWTGDGTANRNIAHNLGSAPGHIAIKKRLGGSNTGWVNWHRTFTGDGKSLFWNTDEALYNGGSTNGVFGDASNMTSTHFQLGGTGNISYINENNSTYVAYVFAHNNGDGTFGPNEDQDIIKCGSYNGNNGSQEINLGFEPQWIMTKNISYNSTDWGIFDTQRLWWNSAASGDSVWIVPNNNNAQSGIARFYPTATGFGFTTENGSHMNESGNTYIYMAIRKGSLFVPENASDVFDVDTMTGTSGSQGGFRSTFRVDFALDRTNVTTSGYIRPSARLTGTRRLTTSANDTESNQSAYEYDYMTGWYNQSSSDSNYYSWMWQRAPKFCDVVAWKGNGSAQNIAHNLEVTPEMIWIKARNLAENWCVFHKDISPSKFLRLNSNAAQIDDTSATRFAGAYPNSSTFPIGSDNEVNGNGYYYSAYLFSTLAGISKVGSYTGTGSSQTIDCGFTNGARFIIIKRANHAEDWLLHDSERGIISGSGDPYLTLNSSDSQLTSQNYVDPHSSGFTVPTGDSQTNNENDTYIFYAIAI